MNAERESGEREFNQYESFEEQIKYIVAPENINKNIYQNLLIGRTPKVWREIGLSDLPVMMSVSHTRENYFPQSSQYPEGKGMGKKLYQLPEKIQDPIAIFASKTHPRDSVVALIELKDKNGKSVITPIEINGLSQNSGHLIDVNRIKTAFGKDNAWKLLRDAVNEEMLGGNTLFYWQKNKAISLAHASGVQFPTSVPNLDGFVHSISENKDLVNTKVLQQTETKQFKRWFGKSKVVNADGTPKVMYHGTRAENGEFYVFDESKAVKKGGLGLKALGKENYFTAKKLDGTERYGSRVIEAYLTIKKPFVYEGGTSLLEQVGKEFGIRTEGMSYDELQKEMRNLDYDGVIQYDSNGEVSIAVTFDSNQIKSATDNIGTFDRSNPDIRYADRATYMTARELLLQAMAEVGKYLISYQKKKTFCYESLLFRLPILDSSVCVCAFFFRNGEIDVVGTGLREEIVIPEIAIIGAPVLAFANELFIHALAVFSIEKVGTAQTAEQTYTKQCAGKILFALSIDQRKNDGGEGFCNEADRNDKFGFSVHNVSPFYSLLFFSLDLKIKYAFINSSRLPSITLLISPSS